MAHFLIAALGSALAALPAAAQAPVIESELHTFRVTTVAEGFRDPWSIAFLPNGDMLATERPGRLRIVRGGMLQEAPIPGVPEVRYEGQGGLLEVALHPDFETNRWLYLSYLEAE